MIKPVVGKVKSPAYALPESDFVYGIESKLDKEGAGEGEEQSALCILIQTSPFTTTIANCNMILRLWNNSSCPKLGPEQGV
jgi:hypothetical protein